MKLFGYARAWLRSDAGAASVEFPLIFFFMFSIVMFAFQVSFAMFELISAEKAAQTAARIASVRDPVHANVPAMNTPVSRDTVGSPCNGAGNNCVPPSQLTWTCGPTGAWSADCSEAAYLAIFNDMRRQGININPADVSISYSYVGLGYAGGPFVPLIRVTVASKPFILSFGFGDKLTRREVEGIAMGEDMTTTY